MKKIFLQILLLTFGFSCFAASVYKINDESIATYRRALDSFNSNDYGTALHCAEDAITLRKMQMEKQIKVLTNALSARAVKKEGDSIHAVLAILGERGEKESIAIIKYYLEKKGEEYFDDSVNNVMEYIKGSIAFPEAHKLIGDIYKLEGEYDFAENYYQLALKNADVLDIPDERYEILYMLAEISRLNNDLPKMETRLLNILVEDSVFKDEILWGAMEQTIKRDTEGSMEKFFTLYRTNSYNSIRAYKELAEYYANAGENEKALHFAALNVLTGFSRIMEILQDRGDTDFEYVNLADFFAKIKPYYDIQQWAIDNKIWEGYDFFASLTAKMGCKNFARGIFKALVSECPQAYWQKQAVIKLQKL